MKRVLGVFLGLSLLFTAAGCAAAKTDSVKEQFLKEAAALGDSHYNAGTFDLQIKELTVADSAVSDDASAQTDGLTAMLLAQLQQAKFSGTYLTDAEKKQSQVDLSIDIFEQKLPIQLFSADSNLYVSGAIMKDIASFIQSFSGVAVDETQFAQYDGKYLDITEDVKDMSHSTASFNLVTSDSFKEYADSLAEADFKKDGDKLSHTFTKDELQDYLAFLKEKGSADEQKTAAELTDLLKEVDTFTLATTLDTASRKLTATLKSTSSDGSKLTLDYHWTPKKSAEKITVPTEDQIIKGASLGDIFTGITDPATEDTADSTMTDAEFQELYDSLQQALESSPDEDYSALLEQIKDKLTDEQYEKLQQLIKGINAAA